MEIKESTISPDLYSAVKTIKTAILESQFRAAKGVNKEQLFLYFGIGKYISDNSRNALWGTGAIKHISEQLQKELPGLRGFSQESLKKRRTFYEQWASFVNRSPKATDLQKIDNQQKIDINSLSVAIRNPLEVEVHAICVSRFRADL